MQNPVYAMKNQKSHVYESEVKQFRKDQKAQRKSRQEQRATKRNYQEGEDA